MAGKPDEGSSRRRDTPDSMNRKRDALGHVFDCNIAGDVGVIWAIVSVLALAGE
jgi:hypothetical protein